MHPDRVREIDLHGAGPDEEAERQRELATFQSHTQANAMPLGTRQTKPLSAVAQDAKSRSPPTMRGGEIGGAAWTVGDDAFDFGRGDQLPQLGVRKPSPPLPSVQTRYAPFAMPQRVVRTAAPEARYECPRDAKVFIIECLYQP